MEAKKSGWLRDAWEDTEKRHVICFVAFVLIIAIVIGAYFGIKGQNLPTNLMKEYEVGAGVYVREVEIASPALAAGIKAGDIIISVGGEPVDGIRTFSDVVLECSTREIVKVEILRKAEDGIREISVEVSLQGKNN